LPGLSKVRTALRSEARDEVDLGQIEVGAKILISGGQICERALVDVSS